MKRFGTAALAVLLLTGAGALAEEKEGDSKVETKKPTSVHDFKVKSLDDKEVDLAEYKGKVLIVVNVASECGATPQYAQLQAMYDKYSSQGLVVMGFPCNQFGSQEPGSATEIRQFCSREYAVKFPMFAKVEVNGTDQAPIYDFLKSNADDHKDIGWNFEKFIVGKDGKVAARFGTRTQPDAPSLVTRLEEELAK